MIDTEIKLDVWHIDEVGWKVRATGHNLDIEGYGESLSEALRDLSDFVGVYEDKK